MPQLTDKKNKIIIYLLLLFILSTTSGKLSKNNNSYSSQVNQINIEGLSRANSSKIYDELKQYIFKKYIIA